MRSYSIRRANSRRRAAAFGKDFIGLIASRITANEVGSTQLLVCGVHPQPRYESFCSVIFRGENKRARQRRQVALSRGQSLQIHLTPAATASRVRASAASTQQASAVTHDPLFTSADAGHEPSASCALRKNSRPRAGISLKDALLSCARNARTAQQVDSTRLRKPGWNPQPPSGFCAVRISGRQKFAANTDSVARFCESRLSPAGVILIGLVVGSPSHNLARRRGFFARLNRQIFGHLLNSQLADQPVQIPSRHTQRACAFRLAPAALTQRAQHQPALELPYF